MNASRTSLVERLERLVTGGRALTVEPSFGILLQRIADLAREVVQARFAAIGLLRPDRQTLEYFVTSGIDPEAVTRIGHPPVGRGVLGIVIREGKPMRIRELAAHPGAAGFPPHHPAMHSFLGVPVTGQLNVLGNLYFTEKIDADEFSDEDEYLAVLLAGMAGTALENARHHEESARLLAEVQDLMKSRERFFATVNHELRNSLAAVLGWAEMLVRRKDPTEVPRAAFEVLESAESAVGLINDLLDLSRLDEDRLKPVLTAVDCGVLVDKVTARMMPAAAGRGIRIETRRPPVIPVGTTDPHRVEQILVNVLGNALRHSPENATVEVSLEPGPDHLVIRIRDHGSGITAENLLHIFDVYFSRGTRDGAGVGLGLPLSRRLARLLGGELSAANHQDGGAVFTLALPLNVRKAATL